MFSVAVLKKINAISGLFLAPAGPLGYQRRHGDDVQDLPKLCGGVGFAPQLCGPHVVQTLSLRGPQKSRKECDKGRRRQRCRHCCYCSSRKQQRGTPTPPFGWLRSGLLRPLSRLCGAHRSLGRGMGKDVAGLGFFLGRISDHKHNTDEGKK